MVYCQIKVNVGPMANLAVGAAAEVPLLVKVFMTPTAVDYALEKEILAPGMFGAAGPGLRGRDVRGLVGIRVLHPIEQHPVPGAEAGAFYLDIPGTEPLPPP